MEKSKDFMEEKKAFKALAGDMLPVINRMNEILEKHGVDCLASITMSTDGYFTFTHHNTSWEFIHLDADENPKIRCLFHEEIQEG